MGNSASSNQALIVGLTAGAVLVSSGFAGLSWLFYSRLNQATRLENLEGRYNNSDFEQLNAELDILRKEIEELKARNTVRAGQKSGTDEETSSRKSSSSRRNRGKHSVISTTDTEYQSIISDSEEFFDCSDAEDGSVEELSNGSIIHQNQEALQLFDKVDALFESSLNGPEEAFGLLSSCEKEYEKNVEFLWRIAKCCRSISQDSNDERNKKEWMYRAHDYAKRALAADKDNAEANKWFAITIGSLGTYVGVSEKIRNGALFKAHIDKAILLNPNDPMLYHLLGRFCFEVSSLSWIERKVASTLFSEVPSGSISDALSYFHTTEDMRKKPWKENRLLLARCFIHLGQYSEAMKWIDRALQVPVLTKEDETMHDELKTLQRKYSAYRCP